MGIECTRLKTNKAGKRNVNFYTGWAEKHVPNFKAVLLLNCITEKAQIWMV